MALRSTLQRQNHSLKQYGGLSRRIRSGILLRSRFLGYHKPCTPAPMKYGMEIDSNGIGARCQEGEPGRHGRPAEEQQRTAQRHCNISVPGCVLKSADPFSSPPLMDDASATAPFIIRGITTRGARFRPSDWTERLAGGVSGGGPPPRP